MVFKCFFQVFLQVFQMHVSSVSSTFGCMLQMLHLDILKVDRVLHLPPRFLLFHLDVSSSGTGLGIRCLHPLLDAGNIWGGTGPMWTRENGLHAQASGRPVCPDASKPVLLLLRTNICGKFEISNTRNPQRRIQNTRLICMKTITNSRIGTERPEN
jgi:hypothetical protein